MERWSHQFRDANVGLLTGASGLTVVDLDRPELLPMAEYRCGPARLVVRSPRGRHLYYRASGERTTVAVDGVSGFDVRGKNGVIVAPPSVGTEGGIYEFERGSWDEVAHLTAARPGSLPLVRDIAQGSRNATLWRLCMIAARKCETEDELLTHAESLNEGRCSPPLDHKEVRRIAACAWTYEASGRNFVGRGGGGLVDVREVDLLLRYPDALCMLAFLKKTHAGTGTTSFALAAEAMAKAGTLPGWGRKRIMASVRVLERHDLIHMICKGTGRGKPYRFAFRRPVPDE
jgi:hypothetical protein